MCAIIVDHVIGNFVIKENLNSEGYLRLWLERLVPRKLFSNYQNPEFPAETIWFQQDGTRPILDVKSDSI